MKQEILSGLVAACLYNFPSQETIKKSMDAVVENSTITYEKVEKQEEPKKHESKGTGFVLQDKYYTVDHVVSLYENPLQIGAMEVSIPFNREKEITSIDDIPLEEIVNNREKDIAVFKLSKELCAKYCNNLTYSTEPLQIGQQVYMVGNPALTGKTVRFMRISRFGSPTTANKEYKGNIGFDSYIVDGDSGSPVFNMKGEVIGVAQSIAGGIGYFKLIKHFIEAGK